MSSGKYVPVSEQWRGLEWGSAKTSWMFMNDNEINKWNILVKRSPGKYQIETRTLYAQQVEK